jgi:SAM-dependent methyltransferase
VDVAAHGDGAGDGDGALPGFLAPEFKSANGRDFSVVELLECLLQCSRLGFDEFTSPFEQFMREALATIPDQPNRPRVLELGCGSANDYRFWDLFGFGGLIDYCGVDVCRENINNARARFPGRDFRVADACALPMADRSVDVVVAFDLYEHLSEEAMAAAIAETARVSGDELWLSLFNAAHVPVHEIRPVDGYHWNLLSIDLLVRELAAHGFDSQVVDVGAELAARFPGYRHYNEQAFILVAGRSQAQG